MGLKITPPSKDPPWVSVTTADNIYNVASGNDGSLDSQSNHVLKPQSNLASTLEGGGAK